MLGPLVRRALGPLERPVAFLYRAAFFRCELLAEFVRHRLPASEILEVGCGEGLLLDCLARQYPEASIQHECSLPPWRNNMLFLVRAA